MNFSVCSFAETKRMAVNLHCSTYFVETSRIFGLCHNDTILLSMIRYFFRCLCDELQCYIFEPETFKIIIINYYFVSKILVSLIFQFWLYHIFYWKTYIRLTTENGTFLPSLFKEPWYILFGLENQCCLLSGQLSGWSVVNLTSIMRTVFMLIDPKCVKNTVKTLVSFCAFGIWACTICTIKSWWNWVLPALLSCKSETNFSAPFYVYMYC